MKEQLQNIGYMELCSMVQEKKITWSEYIDAQPDLYEGYDEWLQHNGLQRNDENAMKFIGRVENEDMHSQVSDTVNESINMMQAARRVLQG